MAENSIQQINPDLITTHPLPNHDGYTWTLASRLSDMLYMAQELFGERDLSYTPLGIEFIAEHPRIWYPGDRRHIIIQLDHLAAQDASQACYQLAHECVHLLAPTVRDACINLEEGVACYFAALYMKVRLGQPTWRPMEQSYLRALDLITPRLDADIQCIRRLRARQPSFSKMTRDDIAMEFSTLKADDLDFLASHFQR